MSIVRAGALALISIIISISYANAQGYVPMRDRVSEAPTPIRLPVSTAVPVSFFTGSWGQVSFNDESEIPKMRGVARQYCGSLAVSIGPRSPETFGMYVGTDLKEVQVFEQGGGLYIIPVEQLNDGTVRGARELRVLDNNAFTLRYLEAEAFRRYGPNLFVRCGSRDPVVQNTDATMKSKPKKRRMKKQDAQQTAAPEQKN